VTGELSERVRALPGMDRLLPALDGLPPAYLVGGAVRDLLRGASAVDLDLAVEGDAASAAAGLAARLGGEAVVHDRFGTATARAGDLVVDLAQTRRETYEGPGALPSVEPAGLAEDLGRRDFTVNAMAVGLSGDDLGQLHDPHGGRRDLESRTVRVLHPASFVDDPTRLLRAVRYEVRLGFRMDAETEGLARDAAASGALGTVSGARVRDELLDLLAEPEAAAGVARLRELGLYEADPELMAKARLAGGEVGADPVLVALAVLARDAPPEWVEGLDLDRHARDAVERAARGAAGLAEALALDQPPSRLHLLLRDEPPEALALALALGAPPEPVRRFVRDLRDVRLEITGDDLIAAGVPESPALGQALEETLRRKLDGEVSGRDDELRVALEVARGEET
jgi:tRNA nucleotidyltransferase (CCA-adding enzyme)